jgi:N-acetylglucosaminyldiphosphoundecaprenol N-acetyl-beta-D-mannosaminyltransferase
MASLFGIDLPQTNKFSLKNSLRTLKPSSKATLYFLYSEFMLRANRNPWYKHILQKATYTAIDGKGLHWSMWTIMGKPILPHLYGAIIRSPYLIRIPIFIFLFPIQLLLNGFIGGVTLLSKFNFTQRTKNEVILGRDFVYDLLKMGEDLKWKTLVLGGSSQSDSITKEVIQKLFPNLELITWNREFNSLLMRDQPDPTETDTVLNSENVCQVFPDLYQAKKFIQQEQPELILTCLGGASGKQEFFIDNIKNDTSIQFALATGLGAAVDHLGGGQKQPKPPTWMVKTGLEWLFRLIKLPKRRGRIIDSILTLWWWTTVQQFISQGYVRDTAINVVYKEDIKGNSYLLVDRPRVLPGDIGYSFVQGGIGTKEGIAKAGLRELTEETSIKKDQVKQMITPIKGNCEYHTISLLRFLVQGARFNASQHFVNAFEYNGHSKISINWENRGYQWVPEQDVEKTLSIEKRKDWQLIQLELKT